MNNNNRGDYSNRNRYQDERDTHWLHGHHQGQNSDRGNYTVDSHFNRGYGDNAYSQYADNRSFNSNADQSQMSTQGRFRPGGAQYSGHDYTQGNRNDNPYGMSYFPDDDHNSGRHYEARADYSDRDYESLRQRAGGNYRSGSNDVNFGHDVSRREPQGNWTRGDRGDYESYRRYEEGNPNFDNDYRGGFSGRNYAPGQPHYGEGQYYSQMDSWQNQSEDAYEQYLRNRDRR